MTAPAVWKLVGDGMSVSMTKVGFEGDSCGVMALFSSCGGCIGTTAITESSC